MKQVLSPQQLANRLIYLEREMKIIREEVKTLRRRTAVDSQTGSIQTTPAYSWADKREQRRWFDRLCATLAIKRPSIGAELLQREMKEAGLNNTELSRGITEARDE